MFCFPPFLVLEMAWGSKNPNGESFCFYVNNLMQSHFTYKAFNFNCVYIMAVWFSHTVNLQPLRLFLVRFNLFKFLCVVRFDGIVRLKWSESERVSAETSFINKKCEKIRSFGIQGTKSSFTCAEYTVHLVTYPTSL